MTERSEIAQMMAEQAKQNFVQFLFIGWQADGKWVCTASSHFDKEHMTYLRDWLTRQIDAA